MDNYSLSDISSVLGGKENGTGSWFWIVVLFIFMMGFGGNGLFGGKATSDQPATQGQMTDQFNFEALRQGQADVSSAVKDGNSSVIGTLKDVAYGNLSAIKEVESSVNGILPAMENCCCNILRSIDQSRFDMANMNAAIQANNTANTQKVLDTLCANREADMQNQINQLQLQSALCGVMRYPNPAYVVNNPYGCGCSGTTF